MYNIYWNPILFQYSFYHHVYDNINPINLIWYCNLMKISIQKMTWELTDFHHFASAVAQKISKMGKKICGQQII